MRRSTFAATLAVALLPVLAPAAAQAQAEPAPVATPGDATTPAGAEPSVYSGDYLTLGIGVGYGAQYEGADDYELFPAPLIQGRLGGIAISPRPGGIALDLVPDGRDAALGVSLGPVVRYRSNRTDDIKDPRVAALGELDAAVEVGANAGVTVYRLLSPYDSLTIASDIRWDIAGAHDGRVIAPSVSYFTPVSRGAAMLVSLGAEHVDDAYADYYFSVSAAGATLSGLPAFDADGGWKSYGAMLLGVVDFDGNLANGGVSAFALGGYTRMAGDARRTPLTRIAGDADQWIIGAGLAYTF